MTTIGQAGRDPVPPRPEEGGSYDAFISYQRNDLVAVERIRDELHARGKLVWMDVDYENIPAGTNWEERITRGIEACKAFIFVISHGSRDSGACKGELADAVELHKLIIPIVHEYVDPSELPVAVAQTQWIDLRDGDRWDAGIAQLVDALESDVGWRDEHTRYAGLAREWRDHNRDGSFLLRGSDLSNAEAWLAQQAGHREQPTEQQREYITVSRQGATRRQRILIAALTTGLVVATVLAVFALIQRASAIHETHLARAQLRASQALTLASTAARVAGSRLDESLLLALEANRLEPSLLQARTVMTSDLETVRAGGIEAVLGPGGAAKALDAVAYSPNGELLAAGGTDGIVRIYDIRQRKLVAMLHNGPRRAAVNSVAFAPSGALLATGGSDGRVRLFTVSQDKLALVHTAIANRATNTADQTPISGEYGVGVNSVAFAPSSATLAAGSKDGGVRLFRASSRSLRLLHAVSAGDPYDSVTSVAFSPGGAAIAAGIGDGMVRLVDVSSRRLILRGEIEGAPQGATPTAATSVTFAPGGAMLAAGGEGGTLQLIGVSGGKLALVGSPYQIGSTTRLNVPGVTAVTFASGETMLATATASATGAGAVQLFGVSRGRLTPRGLVDPDSPNGGGVKTVAFAPDGTALAAAGGDGLVRLFGVADGRLPATGNVDQTGEGTNSLAFEPDGAVLAAGDSDGRVRLFGLADGELKQRDSARADGSGDELGGGVAAVAFGRRGTTLAAGSADGIVRLFAVSHDRLTLLTRAKAASAANGGVSGVAFEDAGSTLFTSGSGATVRLFAVSHRRLGLSQTAKPAGANAEFLSLASAPDSSMLALDGGRQPILIAVSHKRVTVLRAVTSAGSYEAIALSNNGRLLAIVADHATRLYRVSHGVARLVGSAPTAQGNRVEFSPDGRTLAVGTQDGLVLFAISGRTLTELLKVPDSNLITSFAFSPNGTELAVGDEVGVRLLDLVWPDYAYLRTRVCSLVWRSLSRSEWHNLAPPGLRNPTACQG